MLAELADRFVQAVDPVHGGIRGAPKFPQSQFFNFLWRAGLRYGLINPLKATDITLTNIAQGGIYDHLGGGFSRYSTDERWLVPHFEKMLYDNAQIVEQMTELWRENKTPLYAQRIEESIDWLLREMTTEGGGFAASLDADSEGVEGKFYVWDAVEIVDVLGPEDAGLFNEIYDVTPSGNWEDLTILNRLHAIELRDAETEARLAAMRGKLLARRASRIRPGFDDKVLADWNGLMIASLANAADAFQRPAWLEAAKTAFNFVRIRMERDGRLFHAYRTGATSAPGTASDYANMIRAALELANVTGDPDYIAKAKDWASVLDRHYWSEEFSGYYFAADDTADLIVRPLNAQDEATPNANGVMISNLVALYLWTGEEAYLARAERMAKTFSSAAIQNIFAHSSLLGGVLDLLAPAHIVIVVPQGADATELRQALSQVSLPGAVVQEIREANGVPASSPAHGKTAIGGKATAYVCIGPQCSAPVTEPSALIETVKSARRASL